MHEGKRLVAGITAFIPTVNNAETEALTTPASGLPESPTETVFVADVEHAVCDVLNKTLNI